MTDRLARGCPLLAETRHSQMTASSQERALPLTFAPCTAVELWEQTVLTGGEVCSWWVFVKATRVGGALAAVWWLGAGPFGVFIAIACGFIVYGVLNLYLLAQR